MNGVLASDSESVSGGLEFLERLPFSASSLRNASNSRSNLESISQWTGKGRASRLYILAPKDFDIESAAVPYTHSKDQYQEGTTPSGAIVQQVHRGQLSQDRIH